MNIAIRVDSSVQMGSGHAMRCMALAQGHRQLGGETYFLIGLRDAALESRLRSEGLSILHVNQTPGTIADAEETTRLADQHQAAWVVTDGYQFGSAYQARLSSAPFQILFIDDYGHVTPNTADLILNQNLGADSDLYSKRGAGARLLLGPEYALLRSEFMNAAAHRRLRTGSVSRILVTLGGGDPDNVTLKVIEALTGLQQPGLDVRVVIGAASPHQKTLQTAVEGKPGFQLLQNVTDMSSQMAWADLAVSAGGITCWEMAYMGLPNIIFILADNQAPGADALDRAGISLSLGRPMDVSIDSIRKALRTLLGDELRRTDMSRRGMECVDGQGVSRVLRALRETTLQIRPAALEDARLFWIWANDPAIRTTSFSPEPIPWPTHTEWFQKKLNNPNSALYVGMDLEGTPVGQIRFDQLAPGEAQVDVHVTPEKHGQGLGALLIARGSRQAFAAKPWTRLQAIILAENHRSQRAFEKAGFIKNRSEPVHGRMAYRYCLEKPHA